MSDSIPPGVSPAKAANIYFTAASNILSHQPKPLKRTFLATGTELETISANLVHALKTGAKLSEIDKLATEMGRKILEIQGLTLKARRDGVR